MSKEKEKENNNINLEEKNFEFIDIDDIDDLDISIDIDDDDYSLEDEFKNVDDINEKVTLSKHKSEGKHSLKYDSIFKGKKETQTQEEDEYSNVSEFFKDTIDIDKSSSHYKQSRENESYVRDKKVKEKVYYVLKNKTSLSFTSNRRKPSKEDFNNYYKLIKNELKEENFTNIELFNELSIYFSDNIFNMFKILNNKWRNLIIEELQEHIGKGNNSKEVINRNIYEGTEIEFKIIDGGEVKLYTGSVLEVDYDDSIFKVNSFENEYDVKLEDITKILNNTKFKYNLNKLDNIDFL